MFLILGHGLCKSDNLLNDSCASQYTEKSRVYLRKDAMNIFQGLCICLLALQVALQSETRQVPTGWVWPWQDLPQHELVADYQSSGLSKVDKGKEATLHQRSWRTAHADNNYLKTAGLTALTGGLAFGTGVVGKKAFTAYKALQQEETNLEKDPENSDLQKKVARARRKFYAAVFFTLVLGGATGFVGYKGLLPSFRQTRKMWHDNEILRKPLPRLYDINRRRKKAQGVAGRQSVYQISEGDMRKAVKSEYRDAFDTLAKSFQPTKSTASSEMPSQPAGAGAAAGSSAAQESGRLLTASTPRTTADDKKDRVELLQFTAKHLDPTQYRQKGKGQSTRTVTRKDPKAAFKKAQKRLRAAADILDAEQTYNDAIALLNKSNAPEGDSPIAELNRRMQERESGESRNTQVLAGPADSDMFWG